MSSKLPVYGHLQFVNIKIHISMGPFKRNEMASDMAVRLTVMIVQRYEKTIGNFSF